MHRSPPTLTLELLRPSQPPERKTLPEGRHVIGRESGEIVLGDPEASATHAELEFTSGRVIVRDLGSRNGTWRGGDRLPQFALYSGQSFYCGSTELRLVSIDGTEAPKPGQTAIGSRREVDESMPTVPRTPALAVQEAPALELQTTARHPVETTKVEQVRSSTQVPGGAVPPAQGPSSPTLPGESMHHRSAETIPGAGAGASRTRGNTEIPQLPVPAPLADPGASDPAIPTMSETIDPGVGSSSITMRPASSFPPAGAPEPAAPSPGRSELPLPAPVPNAVIKDPAALARPRQSTAPQAPKAPRRWPRIVGLSALVLVLLAGIGALAYFAYHWLSGRTLGFSERIAAQMPADAIGFVAVSSLDDGLQLWGDEVPPQLREHATKALGFDPLKQESWEELGIDPAAPLGAGVLSGSDGIVIVSVPITDREAFADTLRDEVSTAIGAAAGSWVERSFAGADGLWLDEPLTIAVVWKEDRAQVVTSVLGDRREAIEDAAEELAELQEDATLATRPGFSAIVPPPGTPIVLSYVDGASLRDALPTGGVEGIAARMALADVEGFALVLSGDDSDIHVTTETMLREGSRPLSLIAESRRDGKALEALPAKVVAALDVAYDPGELDRALSGAASLGGGSLAFWEQTVRDELGVDLREDLVDNLGGDMGAALLRLPNKPDGSDIQAVAWLSVEDPGKAKVVLERLLAKSGDALGVKVRKEGELDIYYIDGTPMLAWFLADGFLWFVSGEADLYGDGPSFGEPPSHPAIADVAKSRDPAIAFVDVAMLLEQLEASEPQSKELLEQIDPVTSIMPAVTLRTEVRRNVIVTQVTLHTTQDEGLAALVQRIGKTWGVELAEAMAAKQREEKCERLVVHVTKLTSDAIGRAGTELPNAWELERQVLEECTSPQMPEARIDCYLGAKDVEALQACDQVQGDEGSEVRDDKEPDPVPTDAKEPKPVPYVDDIWPRTADDADSTVPQTDVNYAVGVGEHPQVRGSADALVTIVEFGDFQCQYCRRVAATLDEVLAEHGQDVRIVFRHRPLTSIHPQARTAARAAIAAGRQDRFWQMHDALFANPSSLGETGVRKLAEDLGLDMVRFDRDLHDAATDRQIERDIEAAEELAVTGTPVFFVNGRYLPGAQTKAAFSALIAEEKERAQKFVQRRGDTRVRLYEDMIGHFAPEVIQPTEPDTGLHPDEKLFLVSTNDLPQKGSASLARVQIVECGDFDCPFCARVAETVDELLDEYPTQVAFYFAHQPLPHHAGAEPAARAAVAADEQGKFWEMHDRLFEQTRARSEDDLIAMARELGLDVAKFKADFASPATVDEVARQKKLCADNEATGTPTFFINGRKVAGAQPLTRFKAMVDRELAGGI